MIKNLPVSLDWASILGKSFFLTVFRYNINTVGTYMRYLVHACYGINRVTTVKIVFLFRPSSSNVAETESSKKAVPKGLFSTTPDQRHMKLAEQAKSHNYHRFVNGNLIVWEGILDKRKVRLA